MKMRDLGEFRFINRISKGLINRTDRVVRGFGDDCAIMKASGGMALLFTSDMLIEGVHFRKEQIPPDNLGRKALAVNLSDIAAMGGTPCDALVSVGIPADFDVEYLDKIYMGMKSMAAEHHVNILGGDTVLSPERLVVSVAMTGEEPEDEILYRDGAQPGDVIFLTGKVGASAAGLDLLENGREFDSKDELLSAHFDPRPHVAEGRIIASSKLASSLIDVSDGLVGDLGHICEQSNVGAEIEQPLIPNSETLKAYCGNFNFDLERFTVYGGEDYVLLGTISEDSSDALAGMFKGRNCSYFPIGRIVEGEGLTLKQSDGTARKLGASGHDHFRTKPNS